MAVIQLMGLPGSGKSTLARGLMARLGWPGSFRLGSYHKRFPSTVEGDTAAWRAMFEDMGSCGWTRFIFETTGLDERWRQVLENCGRSNVLTFKLECELSELIRRIAAKNSEDQSHGDWFPPDRFTNKTAYVQAVFSEFSSRRGDVVLNTTRAPAGEILDLVVRFLSAQHSCLLDPIRQDCEGRSGEELSAATPG
ncbi:MAG: AAA family ATPase [Terriglobia bacterium]